MRRVAPLLLLVAGAVSAGAQTPAARVLESFDDVGAFRAAPSDGVALTLRGDTGVTGRALRLDYDFNGHAGYAVARRSFHLPALPPYWSLTLWVRGDTKPNTLELKLVDSTGLNVWWLRRPELVAGPGWTQLRFRPSDLSFAWGPGGGGPPRGIAALEIAFTAGAGGRGWLALDALTLTPQSPPVAESVAPRLAASSSAPGHPPGAALPRDFARAPTSLPSSAPAQWHSAGDGAQWLSLDFGGTRALSALVLDWSTIDWPLDYDVERAGDDGRWSLLRTVRGSAGGRRFVHLPLTEATRLRIVMRRSSRRRGYALGAVRVMGDSVAATRTAFLERVAQGSAQGLWPRQLIGQQGYWTVVGLPADDRDALFSEDGALESHAGSFSLEPFLFADGELLTWRDGATSHSLDGDELPIPTARRHAAGLTLAATATAWGWTGHSTILVRYRIVNERAAPRSVDLFAVARPVQVNPPWQFLGVAGGAASVRSVRWTGRDLVINDSDVVSPMSPVTAAGAASFDAGSALAELREGLTPATPAVDDPTALATGVLKWHVALPPHDSADVWVRIPDPAMRGTASGLPDPMSSSEASAIGEQMLAESRGSWEIADGEGDPQLHLPGEGAELAHAMRTALAHIRINARGAAIQPGTRSYQRSWIRDGALTAAALLRLGHQSEVRDFIQWYLPYVYPNGKVPCCVDARGADPVPENDADGELLYLVAEYTRVTRASSVDKSMWPILRKVAMHLDSLRRSRRTEPYARGDSLLVFGLLPPSISHEGYSAKPAYSYWDDWWGVRGLDDAEMLARLSGDTASARVFGASAREMRGDVVASIAHSMALHHKPTLPGAAELGDLDPTSSTIALSPAQALGDLPRAAVLATFDSAWATLERRRQPGSTWDAFVPYEWRDVGAFIRLGQPERADAYSTWLMSMRRPLEWNQWSEVVWRDPRTPRFIGDMPHGWVASDFIRATLDRFAYERAADSVTVIAAGIPLAWLDRDRLVARNLHGWWGTFDLTITPIAEYVRVEVDGAHGPGGLEIHAPFGRRPIRAVVNGHDVPLIDDGRAVRVPRTPASVDFFY